MGNERTPHDTATASDGKDTEQTSKDRHHRIRRRSQLRCLGTMARDIPDLTSATSISVEGCEGKTSSDRESAEATHPGPRRCPTTHHFWTHTSRPNPDGSPECPPLCHYHTGGPEQPKKVFILVGCLDHYNFSAAVGWARLVSDPFKRLKAAKSLRAT